MGHAPVGVPGRHRQWLDGDRAGGGHPLDQAVGPVLVHEEPDGPAVHPKDRPTELQVVVDGVQEQAVAAEGHDDVAVAGVDQVVAGGELGLGRPGLDRVRRHTGDAGLGGNPGHGASCQRRSARRRRNVRSGFCSRRAISPGAWFPRRIASRGRGPPPPALIALPAGAGRTERLPETRADNLRGSSEMSCNQGRSAACDP
jgi:hypothetical protein